jgi:hypothetical protein
MPVQMVAGSAPIAQVGQSEITSNKAAIRLQAALGHTVPNLGIGVAPHY